MSILIKGLKMPTNCEQCIIFDPEEDECGIIGKTNWIWADNEYCETIHPRPDNCPLKETTLDGDLISRRDAILRLVSCFRFTPEMASRILEAVPSAQPEQKKGKWERNDDGIMIWWECSECHHDAWYDREELTNYCPNCGVKMEEEEE